MKEEAEYIRLTTELNKLDMKRAIIMNSLRENKVFALKYITDVYTKIANKYYAMAKTPEIVIKFGENIEVSASINVTGGFIVKIPVKVFNRDGSITNTKYDVSSPKLPKNVYNWLSMGHTEISHDDAKEFVTRALTKEKKELEARIKQINAELK